MIVRTYSYEALACYTAACRPPTSGGTGGSSRGRIASGWKAWWRMQGGSAEITSAAHELTGRSSSGASAEAKRAAGDMIEAINGQPVQRTPLFSGHVRAAGHEVGETIEVPLMALAYSKKLSEVYAGVESGSMKDPFDSVTKNRTSAGVLMSGLRAAYPGKTNREVFEGLPVQLRDQIGQSIANRRIVTEQSAPSVGVVYRFASSKSALVDKGRERATSGRYKVTAVEEKPIPGSWVWDQRSHELVPHTYQVVTLDYDGPLSTS